MISAYRILITLALVPGILLAIKIYTLDKIEKEPVGLVIKLLVLGAISVIPALVIEMVLDVVISAVFDPETLMYMVVDNFIGIACVEEAVKYFTTKKCTWKSKEFDFTFDGIVYATAASIGFALAENVSYAISYGLATTIIRAVTAIPAHAIFGLFMGHYYGIARGCANRGDLRGKKKNIHKAYIIPVILHGVYDFFADGDSGLAAILFFVFVVVLDIVAYRRIMKDSREDKAI